ncbi:preprotein translocase subunit SecA [Rhizomicrobium palustre]|uniref:Protein translocase subunit SecA n=1 Tax=Rhizomicrobium palustre TaxID=189966 RepID=A0A846N332_9PROT|nr:preprotein translocase subunit SecA [Rhizomicrobium palustre]NIK90023.1 preprotein translocase subunit SecA [Rhizomicrobium palustre]
MSSFDAFLQRLFGSANERKLKRFWATVKEINALEPRFKAMTDEELAGMTPQFKDRLKGGESLEDLLPEAFAVVREAALRTLGQRHYDVQLVGGMVLHHGNIAEMRTGEGKTLVGTLPVYLNALAGEGVHVVTVNDYLAKRDCDWMGQIYRFLGMSVGCILHGLTDEERRAAYAADITYGTNNEFGFDYLRDNMKYTIDTMVQRGHAFVIVDEVDSILIDEARTPLIISGPTEDLTEMYRAVDTLIPSLIPPKRQGKDVPPEEKGDYELDEKQRQVTLTDLGNEHMVQLLKEAGLLTTGDLYDIENISMVHHVNQALKAHKLFQKDKDYIVKNNEVVIIDEFTGRMMQGRRFSEGLHQALEAKEGVAVQPENVTLASITFQNYFRLYDKLAGMTGTALTEAAEFMDIYELDVIEIPTNVPVKRKDYDDEVYRSFDEKNEAIIKLIEQCQKKGQPVLVGTTSIEKSEHLSDLLKQRKIKHNVLNARYHETEAEIVAQAGVSGTVTIATNMAGRGTDIQLGGNAEMRIRNELGSITDPEELSRRAAEIRAEVAADKEKVIAAGGLYIIGTERHESRRIDNQLRGRSGRQGDPGASKFFLSLQDDLMRIFGSERMDAVLTRLGLEPGEAITHPWVNKALEKAQQKVEARNFEIRKQILKYDNVLNDQRKVIFEQRKIIMSSEDVSDEIKEYRATVVEELVERHIPPKAYAEQWDAKGLEEEIKAVFDMDLPIVDWAQEEGIADEEVRERVLRDVEHRAAERAVAFTPEIMRYAEKAVLLQTLDHLWREHIINLEHLRQYVGLRGYGQRDPLNEYKSEAFELFEGLLSRLRLDVVRQLMHIVISMEQPPEIPQEGPREMYASKPEFNAGGEADADPYRGQRTVVNQDPDVPVDPNNPATWGKVQRNAPCPCGSGRKFKHCHGALV